MRVLQVHAGYRHPGGRGHGRHERGRAAPRRRSRSPDVERAGVDRRPRRRASTVAVESPSPPARPARLSRSSGRDVAHIHNTWYSLSPSVIAAIHDAGIPVVMSLHNYRLACVTGEMYRDGRVCTDCLQTIAALGRRARLLPQLARRRRRLAGLGLAAWKKTGVWHRYVDRMIAPSRFFADMVAKSGLPADRILVKPHFVADPGPRAAPPSASNRIVFVGRLSEAKGVRTLLEAWRRNPPVGHGARDHRRRRSPRRSRGRSPAQRALRRMAPTRCRAAPPDDRARARVPE